MKNAPAPEYRNDKIFAIYVSFKGELPWFHAYTYVFSYRLISQCDIIECRIYTIMKQIIMLTLESLTGLALNWENLTLNNARNFTNGWVNGSFHFLPVFQPPLQFIKLQEWEIIPTEKSIWVGYWTIISWVFHLKTVIYPLTSIEVSRVLKLTIFTFKSGLGKVPWNAFPREHK